MNLEIFGISSEKYNIIKEFVQPKMTLNNREFIIWKERGRGMQICGGRQVSRQAYLSLA
jgi:hypothetical protein